MGGGTPLDFEPGFKVYRGRVSDVMIADQSTPADATTTRGRKRRGALAAFAAIACVGCCSIPFLASLSVFGVAICSTKFLGAAFGVAFTVLATVAVVAYRRRRRRAPAGPVPVQLGLRLERVDDPK